MMNTVTGTDGSTPSFATVLKESRISVQPGFQAKEWTVLSTCGQGSGDVYKVKHRRTEEMGAMKIEGVKRLDESCLLKESKIYRALIKHSLGARHVAEMLAFDQMENGNLTTQYLIMGFLGPNVKDMKAECGGKFELSTVLRIGIQTLCGIKMIHDVGYVHRHLRPQCFMLGNPDTPEKSRIIYVTDFQIARRFLKRAKNNMGIYREEREPGSVKMHGYVRYCSVSVHQGYEHRCRDDIWSWIYILAELLDKLPWQNIKTDPTRVHAMKMIIPDSQLFTSIKTKDLKGYLTSIPEYIRTVHADSKPDYVGIYRRLKNASNICGAKFSDPYDWELSTTIEQSTDCFLVEADLQKYFSHEEMQIVRKGDQRVELDPMFFRDDSSPKGVQRAPRIRCNTESLEVPSFIDVDVTQQSQSSASGRGSSVKRTYRKDVSSSKKKLVKESGGGGEGSAKSPGSGKSGGSGKFTSSGKRIKKIPKSNHAVVSPGEAAEKTTSSVRRKGTGSSKSFKKKAKKPTPPEEELPEDKTKEFTKDENERTSHAIKKKSGLKPRATKSSAVGKARNNGSRETKSRETVSPRKKSTLRRNKQQ